MINVAWSQITHGTIFRSSRLEVISKKGILKNASKFTRKHRYQSFFYNEIEAEACNLLKKGTVAQIFSCEFWDIFKNSILYTTHSMAASWF